MLTLRKVAVTGGVSSGKSLVCHYFGKLGAYILDTDQIVHRLLDPTTDLGKKITALLGSEVIDKKSFNREKIAKKVFANPKLLKELEALLHPKVYEEVQKEYLIALKQTPPPYLFVVEVPLLFESEGEKYFDTTVAVIADTAVCRKRCKTNEFNMRQNRQMSQEEKVKRADYAILNNGSVQKLETKTKQLFDELIHNQTIL